MLRRLHGFVAAPLAVAASLGILATPSTAMELAVGCPWVPEAININTNNFGYPDAAANYSAAVLPTSPEPGSIVVIKGQYPQARYFSFQIADGFQLGNLTDQIPDEALISDLGYGPNTDPAELPAANHYGYDDHYQITIRFEDAPVPPATRAPNTLYAGVPNADDPYNKQLVMRLYLPNPDKDIFGDVPLPDLILQTPARSIDFDQTTDALQCAGMTMLWNSIQGLVILAVGLPNPVFKPVTSGANSAGLYPNGDSTYLRAVTSSKYGQLVVVRTKAASYPPLPPATSSNVDVRYWSLCENELNSTHGVGCVADRDMVLQADGTGTTVISADENRPTTATAGNGYNWITWGGQTNAFVVLRQILASPDFPGNYQLAVDSPNTPLPTTLGEWAPDITYCDIATFDANSTAGGAAVMSACKAAASAATSTARNAAPKPVRR